MGYASYLETAPDPRVTFSHIESEAFGLRVGRLEFGPSVTLGDSHIADLIAESDCEAIVLRYPSDRLRLASVLVNRGFTCVAADTLIYMSVACGRRDFVPVEIASPETATDAAQVVAQAFAGYENHYAASPRFNGISAAEAYVDYVVRAISDPRYVVHIQRDTSGKPMGFNMFDVSSSTFVEACLIGVAPEARRQGVFENLFNAMSDHVSKHGIPTIVTSVQTANVGSLRAHTRLGYLPVMSINTVHVMKV